MASNYRRASHRQARGGRSSRSTAAERRAFHILLALAGGERHGYGIIKEVEAQTDRTVRLAPATFYRLAGQMQNDGWIADAGSDDDDERRRYYRLTPRGRRIAQAEAQRLEELVRVARARQLLPALARA